MEMTVLGRYGLYSPGGGACSSYLLSCEEGEILFDAGPGSLSRLAALVLTHLHWDHISDAFPLCYAMEKRGQKVRVFLPKEPGEISELFAGSGMFERVFVEEGMEATICGVTLRFFAMRHPMPCYGARAEGEGGVFAYSGDTNTCANLAPLLAGADLALADACFTDAQWAEDKPHMSARLAAEAMRGAGVKRALLTHLPPDTPWNEAFPGTEAAQELRTYPVGGSYL